jgi:hypothetical protein
MQTTKDLESVLLQPGEAILWRGAPFGGIRLTVFDFFAIPFGLLWVFIPFAILLLIWAGEISQVDYLTYPALILFMCGGFYYSVGRLFTEQYYRSKTRYFLTNQRVIVNKGVFRRSSTSVPLGRLIELRYVPGKNGRGTIEFGRSSIFPLPRGWPGMETFESPAFDRIEDSAHVLQLIASAQAALSH